MHVKSTISQGSMSVKREVEKEKMRLTAYNGSFQKLMEKAAEEVNAKKGGKR